MIVLAIFVFGVAVWGFCPRFWRWFAPVERPYDQFHDR
jgi:hypothetical protein